MLGWFKKAPKWIDEPDEVYKTRARADVALVDAAKAATRPVVVGSFFPASLERIERTLGDAGVPVTRLLWNTGARPGPAPGVLSLDVSRLAHDYGFDGWLVAANIEFSFLFVEHHPLPSIEQVFLDVVESASKVTAQRVRFFVGLDEPLMRVFGGEQVARLMEQLGMGENEAIRNVMVDRAIVNAQKKLEKKVGRGAVPARSSEEWFATNFSGK